jgi:5-methylcytosine-specific restriction endonuclease McrA
MNERLQLLDEVRQTLARMSRLLLKKSVRAKAIYGGAFGATGFSLCSHVAPDAGLDRVLYFVRHSESKLLFGLGLEKGAALADARRLLSLMGPAVAADACHRFAAEVEADAKREREELCRQRAEDQALQSASLPKSIPKRRREIFDASGGKCHYCGVALTLDGRWHIEHKMPRALLGGSEQSNLAASCVNCNARKRDSTDLEFKAKLASECGVA